MAANANLLLSVCYLGLAMLQAAVGHKTGAPNAACVTMIPGHEGITMQPLTSAMHALQLTPTQTLPGRPVSVVVSVVGKAGAQPFKGFFVQARSTSGGDSNAVGSWDVTNAGGLAKTVDCGVTPGSAITHVDNNVKQSVSAVWTAPAGFNGKVVFVATVVQEFRIFWVGIQSETVTIGTGAESVSAPGVTPPVGLVTPALPIGGLAPTTAQPGLLPALPVLPVTNSNSSVEVARPLDPAFASPGRGNASMANDTSVHVHSIGRGHASEKPRTSAIPDSTKTKSNKSGASALCLSTWLVVGALVLASTS